MSPAFGRDAGHARARELAAIRIDEPLEAADAAWLDAHLVTCAECAAAASAYDADRALFGVLRDAPPMPPRDLWARTAAAIDAEQGAGRWSARGRRILGFPAISLAPLAGLAVIAIVVGSGLLNGAPVVPQSGGSSAPAATPIALSPGDVAVLTRGADGSYQVQTGVVDKVCPLVADRCQTAPSFQATELARIAGSNSVGAIISPTKDHLVVVQRGAAGSNGIYVVPVKSGRNGGATAVPTALPTVTPIATATPEPVTSADPTALPIATPVSATSGPDATPSATPAATPTDAPSQDPDASPAATPSEAPAETPSPSPEPTPTPTPSVVVTPAPDGGDAIQIASDVIVVGGIAAYNDDGSRFAFTARPADGSLGPDVYVWNTTEPRAAAVTTDHRSVFAGWNGNELLVSRVVDGAPLTLAVDARTGAVSDEPGHAVWLPAVAPDGAHAAWWDGSVDLADDDLTWVPDKGRLVLGAWPETTGKEQVLAKGPLSAWEVAWNEDGSVMGLWTAGGDPSGPGHLSLYSVDPDTGHAVLDAPILDDVPAFAGFSLKDGRLVYQGPGSGGGRSLWVVAWDGASVGRVELPGEGGATVIR